MEFNPFNPERSGVESEDIAFKDVVRPLLQLRALEDIALDLRSRPWSITDEDIETIKSTWPQLVRLSITYDKQEPLRQQGQQLISGPPLSRPSLGALVALAEHCGHLETLDVEVARVSEDELHRLEEMRAASRSRYPQQMALHTITFARGEYRRSIGLPTDIGHLARVLHAMFPRLGGLEASVKEDAAGIAATNPPLPREWSQEDMQTDVFRLLVMLEELKLRATDEEHGSSSSWALRSR